MSSFTDFPTFGAPHNTMNFDWQGLLLAQLPESQVAHTTPQPHIVHPRDMYHPNFTSSDIQAASSQFVDAFDQGEIPLPYDAMFGIADAPVCPSYAYATVPNPTLESPSADFDLTPDACSFGLLPLFYPQEAQSMQLDRPSVWPMQSNPMLPPKAPVSPTPVTSDLGLSYPLSNALDQMAALSWSVGFQPETLFSAQAPSQRSLASEISAASPFSGSEASESSCDEESLPRGFAHSSLSQQTHRDSYADSIDRLRSKSASSITSTSSRTSSSSSTAGPSTSRRKRALHASRVPPKSRSRRNSSSSESSSSMRALPRAIQVSPAFARAPIGNVCPHCGHVPKNPRRKPDLKRHMKTHFSPEQPEWVCCGVPVAEAARYGLADFRQEDVRWVEATGRAMVGGCGWTFSRKDAYHRHMTNPNVTCAGDADGSWWPSTEEKEKKTRRSRLL